MVWVYPLPVQCLFFFFFNDTATTEIYTLSLHDALPISSTECAPRPAPAPAAHRRRGSAPPDRKSTRLNSSHLVISYAVFCLKKKNSSCSHQPLTFYRAPPVHATTAVRAAGPHEAETPPS